MKRGELYRVSHRCDELVSILKSQLVDYVGALSEGKCEELNAALIAALGIDE